MTRTVSDAALMLDVITGPDPRDRHSIPTGDVSWMAAVGRDLGRLRIAFSANLGYAAVDPEVREIAARAATVFERELGCVVEERDPGWHDPYEDFWAIVALDSDLVGMRDLARRHEHEMTPHVVDFINKPWTAEQMTSAVMARRRYATRCGA